MSRTRTCSISQRGFTLLEVLVALLVFAIGLLGATALTVEGFRLEQRALQRAEIALLAADLAGRMGSNRPGHHAYASAAGDHGCASTMTPGLRCTASELAADDLSEIIGRLHRIKPDSRLRVEPGGPDPAVIAIAWHDGEREQTYRLEVAP
ncbi:MAG: type IV pilus modification protein PilV [Gammaproteobacteria bacterium]